MTDRILDPVLTPATMAPTVGHVEAITDHQTTALKLAGWIRTGVAAVVILLGMVGVQVTFKQSPPTPPDQGIAALVKLLEAQKPAPAPATGKTLETATLAELTAALDAAVKATKK